MKYNYYLLSLLLFFGYSNLLYSQQHEIDLLTNKFIERHLEKEVNMENVKTFMHTMQADGSWEDIDYDKVVLEFPAGKHLHRLIEMTLAYRKENTSYSNSAELLQKILIGIDYFFNKRPSSTNWWYIDIGAPQNYMVILLLLKDKIDRETLHYYSSYLEDRTGNKGHKGKNRTWVSSITLYKGCIEDNYELIKTGIESIVSTIEIADDKQVEGIKIDNSIHQHRPQLYSGGYGMSFIADLMDYACLVHGTSFSQLFTPEKIEIIREVMLGGQQLFGYRDGFDFGTIGRNISRTKGATNLSPDLLDKMKIIDPERETDYEAWQRHLLGAAFPVIGNKYFWKSNIMTQHGENFYLSAKILSKRANGTEMINNENLKGYNLPLGATNIMTSGKEYIDIFPVWDWTKVPGTTASQHPDSVILRGYLFGTNEFGGGVSNGQNGIIAYENDYRNVKAKKGYFFLKDILFCLGTGISSDNPENIATTVNQCYSNGEITILDVAERKLHGIKETSDNLKWVHHDNVGYIFPNEANITLQDKIQTGSWKEINQDASAQEISAKVFSLFFDHGSKPQDQQYSYMVVPDIHLNDFRKYAMNHGYEVLSNTKDIQAVKNEQKGIYGIIFYFPGSIRINKKLTISSNKPALVLIEQRKERCEIAVADPHYNAPEIQLTISKKLKGEQVTLTGSGSVITFELPDGEYTGSTVIKHFDY